MRGGAIDWLKDSLVDERGGSWWDHLVQTSQTIWPTADGGCSGHCHLLMPPQAAFIGHFLWQTVIADCWPGQFLRLLAIHLNGHVTTVSLSIIGFALSPHQVIAPNFQTHSSCLL